MHCHKLSNVILCFSLLTRPSLFDHCPQNATVSRLAAFLDIWYIYISNAKHVRYRWIPACSGVAKCFHSKLYIEIFDPLWLERVHTPHRHMAEAEVYNFRVVHPVSWKTTNVMDGQLSTRRTWAFPASHKRNFTSSVTSCRLSSY